MLYKEVSPKSKNIDTVDLEFYYTLTSQEQLAVIKEHGVLIGERDDSIHNMFLYQVKNFYVELAYNKKGGKLWRIGPFDHPVLLGPYINDIDLKDLLG